MPRPSSTVSGRIRHRSICCVVAALVVALPLRAQGASYEALQTFSGLVNQIRLNYVDSLGTPELVHAAIVGMLRSLDPHSRFATRREIERELQWDTGHLAGAGLVLEDVAGEATAVSVYPGSAAARSGIVAGDRILAIDDTLVSGLDAKAVQNRLLGDKGTRVHLRVARGPRLEPDTFHVSVKFDLLAPHAVGDARMLDDATGYVAFREFSLKSGEEVAAAIRRLVQFGKARRIILDLRGNPGGFVGGAAELAAMFLPKGTLLFKVQGRQGTPPVERHSAGDGEFLHLPLLLLIDEGSASASEILAGSLQDHDRALVVGRRSFGKALIQRVLEVPPAGDAVWLTVGYVLTPSGRTIQRRYKGLDAEQYYSFGGRSGSAADTAAIFRTDHGRPVRGGGGIVPDLPLPGPPFPPRWWSVALDGGLDIAIADSVAATLATDSRTRSAWLADAAGWRPAVLQPFLSRVRRQLDVAAVTEPAVDSAMARRLAARAAEVRWGTDARDELLARSDPDIRAAAGAFARLDSLLAH